ncbi:hypothetical protein ACLK1T_06775 [Escherichia coli]
MNLMAAKPSVTNAGRWTVNVSAQGKKWQCWVRFAFSGMLVSAKNDDEALPRQKLPPFSRRAATDGQ